MRVVRVHDSFGIEVTLYNDSLSTLVSRICDTYSTGEILTFHGRRNSAFCIMHDDLKDAPPFYGVSYCWGLLSEVTIIKCNGADLLLFIGLAEALNYLRDFKHESEVAYHWIDRVIINQADLDQPPRQVQMMRYVFART